MNFSGGKIFKLKGKVQHYNWGGYNFIADWLGIKNTEHKPYAEYWMGAHASASSQVIVDEGEVSLHELIEQYPEQMLGKNVHEKFGSLPFLFKILDVRNMLSIQVHPSKIEAEKGFDKEEASGILINAPNRNYKDKNHKPELMVALSEFWLLHGFLQASKLKNVLNQISEFENLQNIFQNDNYKKLYQYVMNMPQQEVNELLEPLISKEFERKKSNELTKNDPGWWVVKLLEENNETGKDIDRGIFSIYFFNIVKLSPDEGIFQKPGIPHAYLEGQNIELMANSDNVLRGGLTSKHIDASELMKHISFDGILPKVLYGEEIKKNQTFYTCPVPDFGLSKIELQKGETLSLQTFSLEILIVMNGSIQIESVNKMFARKGETLLVLPDEKFKIIADEKTTLFKAFIPELK